MKERIKELRKTLGLTMEKFGEQLGVKKNTVSQWESGTNALSDQMLKAICNVNWNGKYVNEEWFRGNSEEMFKTDPGNELKALAEKYQVSDREYAFLEKFFSLEPSSRKVFFETIDNMFSVAHAGNVPETVSTSTEELESEYKKSRSGSVPKTTLSASSIIEEKKKNA